MSLQIVDISTRNAVAVAISQEGWVTALTAAWAGADVTVRVLTAGAVVLRVQTYGPWVADTAATPRAVRLGAVLATTELAQGTPALIEFVQGSTVIFTATAGVGSGDFAFAGPFVALSRPRLDAVDGLAGFRARAPAGLPLTAPAPAWLASMATNEWRQISGTANPGIALNAWGAIAVLPDGRVTSGAAGGDGNGDNNAVVSLDLRANAPAWSVINTASPTATSDVAYNPDGKPKSRHQYFGVQYLSSIDRVMFLGGRFVELSGVDQYKVDAYNPTTGVWDGVVPGSPGTSGSGYADIPPGWFGAAINLAGTQYLCITGGRRYNVATNDYTTITTIAEPPRYPWCWDTLRGQFFGLCWGNGEGFNSGTKAAIVNGTTQTQITFTPSAALTQFEADAGDYAGMDYDPINDRFLWYSAKNPSRVYVITPNGTTTWGMSILAPGGGSVSLPAGNVPIVGRLRYCAAYSGFLLLATTAQPLYFLKVT